MDEGRRAGPLMGFDEKGGRRMEARPRRSMLYMPGSNARALDKARGIPADALIMDLEDAVAPSAKAEARRLVQEAVSSGGYGPREVIVRVNPLDSPWGLEDLMAVARLKVNGVLVPKVESPEQIRLVAAALDAAGAPMGLPVWAMVETPRAIFNAHAIGGAHPRLEGLVMGTSDLLKEMRARPDNGRESLLVALSLVVLAARANGLDVIDGVFLDLQDEQGFIDECRQARRLGFDGKSLIHPKQVGPANEVFSPSEQEVAWAEEVIQAWEGALAEGKGVAVVRGRMIENLHVEEARRIIALHGAISGKTS